MNPSDTVIDGEAPVDIAARIDRADRDTRRVRRGRPRRRDRRRLQRTARPIPSRATRWRIAILTVALVVASGGLAGSRYSAMTEAIEHSDRAVGAAARERTASQVAVDARVAAVVRASELDGATRTVDGRTLEAVATRAELEGRLAELAVEVEALQGQLREIGTIDSTQVITLVGLQTCLDGIRSASLHQLGGDTPAVVAELQRVEDFCRATMASLGINGVSGFAFDFADPFVLPHDGEYYAYATNAGAGAVQLITSPDLGEWTLVGDVLRSVPEWAESGATWAPTVAKVKDSWVLYYTVRERSSHLQCISSAVAPSPRGPYIDDSTEPLVCQRDRGGSIDPSPWVDDKGVVHLLWKSDDIVRGRLARLWVLPMDETGRKPGWFPVELGHADRPWEGRVVEGPSMVRDGDRYYVLYSGNHWGTVDYAVGYLVCESPLGPCQKPADNVLLRSHDNQNGPGGTEVFTTFDGERRVVYHAWEGTDIGYPNKRRIHTAPLGFANGRPVIG